MDKADDMRAVAANNSSDFVRKLFKMLEDPSYESIVRWGEGGESFVVLENEKFTKTILPKHFKHSNFASFVRQLNKYDFHKVRQNNEDNTPSIYGPNAWEFRHSQFQANKKDSLDNIRRKAPAPRKTTQSSEDPSPHMDIVNSQLNATQSQLAATQTQLQQLSRQYNDLCGGHAALLQHVVQLQRLVKNHDGAMHRVMGFLRNIDAQRRDGRNAGVFVAMNNDSLTNESLGGVRSATPLLEASQLLESISVENLPDKELVEAATNYQLQNDFSTPPTDQGASSSMAAPSAESSNIHYSLGNDLESMVYPVGHTNGIDPINSEHIHNIPYSLPANGLMHLEHPMPDILSEGTSPTGRKPSAIFSVWGPTKPRILLVEDDKVCARIGSKFLQAFECGVEIASNGLEAVHKVQHGSTQFDLVFMDIIMPQLDGVSATSLIRQSLPDIPIIAMTSNIRTDDIDMYFRYGMNDVLPKPFTKDGMLRALEKSLPQFKKGARMPPHLGQMAQMAHPNFVTPNTGPPALGTNMASMSVTPTLRDEASPVKSPATVNSWNSPSQLLGPSPTNLPGNYMQQPMGDNRQYTMTPTMGHGPSGFPAPPQGMVTPRSTTHRRGFSDMNGTQEDPSDPKRQRMYNATPNHYS